MLGLVPGRDLAQTTELISRGGLAALSATANDDSGIRAVNSNGRFVLFASAANNLVTNYTSGQGLDLYLRDRLLGTTALVTVNANRDGGINDVALSASMSEDGRYIVFETGASNLVADDARDNTDIYLRDMLLQTTYLVSRRAGGAASANGESTWPAISADGRFIAYQSTAPDLAANDGNLLSDIFLYDHQARTNLLISRPANSAGRAWSENAVISADGRMVAFTASGTNLLNGRALSPASHREVNVYDRAMGGLIWASTNALAIARQFGSATEVDSFLPALSADGNYVVFQATISSSNPGLLLTLRHDLRTGQTEVVQSHASSGSAWQSLEIQGPVLSSQGRFVAYLSSTNLFQWDAQTASNRVVNVEWTGSKPAKGNYTAVTMSDDGRYVSFLSDATNLVANSPAGTFEIYLRDMVLEKTLLVSTNRVGNPISGLADTYPMLTADGSFLVFESGDKEIVPNDDNSRADVFVRDNVSGAVSLASQPNPGVPVGTDPGHSHLDPNALSGNGRFLAFVSNAKTLVAGINTASLGLYDNLYVHDLAVHHTVLASIAADRTNGANGSCRNGLLSADGRFVAFVSSANNLVPNDRNRSDDVFVRDFLTGTTVLASVNLHGFAGNSSALNHSLSADGRWVVFESRATDLVEPFLQGNGESNVYARDLQNQKTTLLTGRLRGSTAARGNSFNPTISPEGRWVAFVSNAADLVAPIVGGSSESRYFVFDLATGTRIRLPTSRANRTTDRFSFSRNSPSFLYRPDHEPALYVFDLVTGTNQFVCTNCANATISADARFVAYESTTNQTQIYVTDRSSNQAILVSSADGLNPGNGASFNPIISENGRFIAFETRATNLGVDTNSAADVYLYDRAYGRLSLVSGADNGHASGQRASGNPSFSLTGRIIAFESLNDNLAANDRNLASDVFVWRLPPPNVDSLNDVDADALDDAWEVRHFGNLSQYAWEDPDGDGSSNLAEFTAGTSPSNKPPLLRVLGISRIGNTLRLSWVAEAGKRYRVQFKDDLRVPVWNTLPEVTATGDTAEATDVIQGTERFYQINRAD